MTPTTKLSLVRTPEEDLPLSATELQRELQTKADAVAAMVKDWGARAEPVSFKEFEQALRQIVFGLARVAIAWFLARRE